MKTYATIFVCNGLHTFEARRVVSQSYNSRYSFSAGSSLTVNKTKSSLS